MLAPLHSPGRHRHPAVRFAALALCFVLVACGEQAVRGARLIDPPELLSGTPFVRIHLSGLHAEHSSPHRFERLELSDVGIVGDSLRFGSISAFFAVFDRLVVADQFRSPHLAVVDPLSGRIMYRLGKHGEGPEELQVPIWFTESEPPDGTVWAYDFASRRLIRLELGRQAGRVIEYLTVPGEGQLLNPTWFGSHLLSNGLFPDHTLSLIDSTGRAVKRFALMPRPFPSREIKSAAGRMILNRSHMTSRGYDGKFAVAYQYSARLDIVDLNSGHGMAIRGPHSIETRFHIGPGSRIRWESDSEKAYVSLVSSPDAIFGLFCGRCRPNDPPRSIHVFSWEGTFLGEISIPIGGYRLGSDLQNGRLYLSVQTPEPGLVVVPIPDWARRQAGGTKSG